MSLTGDTVWRDHVVAANPSSGKNKPNKAEIRAWARTIEGAANSSTIVKATLAALQAVTPDAETNGGIVLADPTASNNGFYYRSAGAWVKGRGFPDTFAKIALGGTANAQTGSVDSGVDPSSVEVYYAVVSTDNTGAMTLAIDGETARDVVNAAGNALSAGEWTGVVLFFLNDDGDYQLIIDAGAAASAAQSASEAAGSAADALADADRTATNALAVIDRAWFKEVADLIADNNSVIGYTGSGADFIVDAGDIITAQGFRYEVAASGASDHHLTTAGGVNLYVRVGTLAAFGALADGSADASVAAAKMASAFGFVRFGLGNFRFDTSTLTVPLFFDEGGYITVPSANTLTIKSRIESPRQWIFRGGGDYSLVHDDALGIGEDSKQVHASWFGAFPSPLGTTDQAPFIQAAIDAMGNTREGVLQFDNGNYHIASAITVNRGIHIVGVGTRRTVFRAEADGYDMFTTAGAAVRFSGVQFEVQSPTLSKFDGAYIALNHDDCEVADVRFFSPTVGVRVAANNCRISHIGGTYGAAPSSPSALVNVASGSGALVEDVYALTSAYGPDALVRLGGLSDVSNVRVAGIQHILPSRSVWLDASAGNVSRVAIEGVIYNGFAGTPPDYQIDLVTSGAYSIITVSINSVSISAQAPNGVRLLQASSGTMEDVTLDNVVVSGGSGIGVLISRTGGTLNRVRLGDSVNALARATPISYSGTMTDVKVAPAAQPNANAAVCYTYTIADDSVVAINLTRNVFTGVALVTVGSTLQGIYLIRAATSPSLTAMNTPSAGLATAASVLTGTTGVDGNATVGVQPGVIYLENRRGFPQAFHVTLLTGN